MATAKQFLDAIETQKLVSDTVLDELYKSYQASGGAITAEELAKRLTESGALSRDQVQPLLAGPSDSFIQVGADSLGPGALSGSSVLSGVSTLGSSASSSIGGSSIDPGDPFDELKGKKAKTGEKRDAAGRRKHVAKKHKNDFDSPLLLIGGGVLALLVLGGVGLTFLMNLQSGDQLIESARTAYDSGSYIQARDELEQFVEDFTGHARWSEARVFLAVTRLRQLVDTSSDWPRALAVAQEEIPQIEDEEAFLGQRSEFASLLPKIARGLAERADKLSAEEAPDEEVDAFTGPAAAALTLVRNTKYVPKSLRDDGDLAEIEALITRVEKRREAARDLAVAIDAIGKANQEERFADAYAAHGEFVTRRPALRNDERLAAALSAAVEAERESIRVVDEPGDPSDADRPSPVTLALPLADPRRQAEAPATGMFVTQLGGVAYGLDAKSGELRWRRPIGERLSPVDPVYAGEDVLLIDHRHGDLLRLETATGKLVWRVEIETPSAESALFTPVFAGARVLVASESGRLWAINAESGARIGFAQFAQPLLSAPGVNKAGDRAYVLGRQSSLYVVAPETLECVAVKYTGHAAGAAPTPPVAIGGRVLVMSNTGDATSQLTVYSTDQQGAVTQRLEQWRHEGQTLLPASVKGRRVLCLTEYGAAYLYEAGVSEEEKPLTLLSSRVPDEGPPARRRAVTRAGEVWIAGEGLLRTATSLADSQLVIQAIPDPCDRDRFVGPLVLQDKVLLHSRVRDNTPGVTCAATDATTGQLLWETDLAAPPLGEPYFSAPLRGVVVTNTAGETHLIDSRAIKARRSPAPTTQPRTEKRFPWGTSLERGVAVLAAPGENSWIATTVSPRAGSRRVALPGALASPPVAMGSGLLAPLSIGQVLLVNPVNRPLAAPFQPAVEVGSGVAWTPPAVTTLGGTALGVLTDGSRRAYCLEVEGDALVARGDAELPPGEPTGKAALVGNQAAIGLAGGKLALFGLPAMDSPRVVDLPGELVWGPHPAGDLVVGATDGGMLVAISPDRGEVVWTGDLSGGKPIGAPLVNESGLIVVTRQGLATRFDLASGSAQASADLGQRAGSGPSAYSSRLLIAAADGSVLVVNQP